MYLIKVSSLAKNVSSLKQIMASDNESLDSFKNVLTLQMLLLCGMFFINEQKNFFTKVNKVKSKPERATRQTQQLTLEYLVSPLAFETVSNNKQRYFRACGCLFNRNTNSK